MMMDEINEKYKVKIAEEDIKRAVAVCNKTRKFLMDLNDLRKADRPPISSHDFLSICKLATGIDKETFNDTVGPLLKNIKTEESGKRGFRFLLTGSFQDQDWFLDLIEERNASVVCEDMCTRLRYFYGLVGDGNSLDAITKRYLFDKPASACLVSFEQRSSYLLKLIKDFNIDGVIYYILKFDDPYLFEFPDMKSFFDVHNVPVLRVETEHNTSAVGQMMTRVQAFIETLKISKRRDSNVRAHS